MAESEQGSSSSMTTSRQEEDELLNQMEEEERLLDESDGEEKQITTDSKEKAAAAVRVSSVGTLAKNFMKNVRIGSNDVFVTLATQNAPCQQHREVRLKQGDRLRWHRAR